MYSSASFFIFFASSAGYGRITGVLVCAATASGKKATSRKINFFMRRGINTLQNKRKSKCYAAENEWYYYILFTICDLSMQVGESEWQSEVSGGKKDRIV